MLRDLDYTHGANDVLCNGMENSHRLCGRCIQKVSWTGAPFPGVTMHGRYHAPGSVNGWIILETDDISAVYRHAAEWAEFLEMKTTPVLNDEQAAEAAANLNS